MPMVANYNGTKTWVVKTIINRLISMKKESLKICESAQDEINKILRESHPDVMEYLKVEKEKIECIREDDEIHIDCLNGILEEME